MEVEKMADTVFDCGTALGIAEVGQLYAQLLNALAENTSVIVDCSQIERIDAAALQLLYAYSQESAIHGDQVDWQNASEAFINNVRLLGLSEALGIG